MKTYWKPILAIVLVAILMQALIWGVVLGYLDPLLGRFGPPKPYQEIADTLAEYGWEVKDIKVDETRRTIEIAAIPPEDDGEYRRGLFSIFRWAEPIIRPPLDERGSMVYGVNPGVLLVYELTDEGCPTLMLNDKVGQAYGTVRMLGWKWIAVSWFLGEDQDGVPREDTLSTRNDIYKITALMGWYGIGVVSEGSSPQPYPPLEGGWWLSEEVAEPEPTKK